MCGNASQFLYSSRPELESTATSASHYMFQQWHTSIECSGAEGKEVGQGGGREAGGKGGEEGKQDLVSFASQVLTVPRRFTPLVSAHCLKVLQVWSDLYTLLSTSRSTGCQSCDGLQK